MWHQKMHLQFLVSKHIFKLTYGHNQQQHKLEVFHHELRPPFQFQVVSQGGFLTSLLDHEYMLVYTAMFSVSSKLHGIPLAVSSIQETSLHIAL